MRNQIGTVQITRIRVYQLDPEISCKNCDPTTVVVQPGKYPIYEDGISRYWQMTGMVNHRFARLGDGMFLLGPNDVISDNDVVFYSRRYGPDEWESLIRDFATEENPALLFSITPEGKS